MYKGSGSRKRNEPHRVIELARPVSNYYPEKQLVTALSIDHFIIHLSISSRGRQAPIQTKHKRSRLIRIMKFLIFTIILIISCTFSSLLSVNEARREPIDYWKKVMKDEPMPEAIQKLIPNKEEEEEAVDDEESAAAAALRFISNKFGSKSNFIIYHTLTSSSHAAAHHHSPPAPSLAPAPTSH